MSRTGETQADWSMLPILHQRAGFAELEAGWRRVMAPSAAVVAPFDAELFGQLVV